MKADELLSRAIEVLDGSPPWRREDYRFLRTFDEALRTAAGEAAPERLNRLVEQSHALDNSEVLHRLFIGLLERGAEGVTAEIERRFGGESAARMGDELWWLLHDLTPGRVHGMLVEAAATEALTDEQLTHLEERWTRSRRSPLEGLFDSSRGPRALRFEVRSDREPPDYEALFRSLAGISGGRVVVSGVSQRGHSIELAVGQTEVAFRAADLERHYDVAAAIGAINDALAQEGIDLRYHAGDRVFCARASALQPLLRTLGLGEPPAARTPVACRAESSAELITAVTEELERKRAVQTELGCFFLQYDPPYEGRNPRTGDLVPVPEKWLPFLALSKDFASAIDARAVALPATTPTTADVQLVAPAVFEEAVQTLRSKKRYKLKGLAVIQVRAKGGARTVEAAMSQVIKGRLNPR